MSPLQRNLFGAMVAMIVVALTLGFGGAVALVGKLGQIASGAKVAQTGATATQQTAKPPGDLSSNRDAQEYAMRHLGTPNGVRIPTATFTYDCQFTRDLSITDRQMLMVRISGDSRRDGEQKSNPLYGVIGWA